jgi:hypothetical protein
LSTPRYQSVPVTCPNCGHHFVSPVLTLIDVGQDPQAKSLFLSGQANVAVCPQCGNAGTLSTPLVYHDPDKELLLTYVPPNLNLPEPEQQRIIGDLTGRVMSSLPPEKRKGYLLRPRNFFTLDSMIEAVLEADGITPEMLNAQREKAALLERLLRSPDPEVREIVVRQNDNLIDYEFFQLLGLNVQMAQAQGQDQAVQQLAVLQNQLLQWTSAGQEIAARQQAIQELGSELSREGLLDKLEAAAMAGDQTKIETMVAVARPLVDYVLYQQLAGHIEQAEQGGDADRAARLKALRETILEVSEAVDAEMEKAGEEAAALLQEIVDSEDVEQAVRESLPLIDEVFMSILASNIEAAERAGRTDDAQRLQEVGNVLMKVIQESQPAVIQFINQLLTVDYPEGSQALLEANEEMLDPELLEVMDMIHEDLVENERQELAQRLSDVRHQAAALIESV